MRHLKDVLDESKKRHNELCIRIQQCEQMVIYYHHAINWLPNITSHKCVCDRKKLGDSCHFGSA